MKKLFFVFFIFLSSVSFSGEWDIYKHGSIDKIRVLLDVRSVSGEIVISAKRSIKSKPETITGIERILFKENSIYKENAEVAEENQNNNSLVFSSQGQFDKIFTLEKGIKTINYKFNGTGGCYLTLSRMGVDFEHYDICHILHGNIMNNDSLVIKNQTIYGSAAINIKKNGDYLIYVNCPNGNWTVEIK